MTLPPLPNHFTQLKDGTLVYTADQMRAYAETAVLAEREACADMFDMPAHLHGEAEDWNREVAAAIRSRK